MRGLDLGDPDVPGATDNRRGAPSPNQTSSGRGSPPPTADVFPDAAQELQHLIGELGEHINFRITHRRIKYIAARLLELLPDLRVSGPRASPSVGEHDGIALCLQKVLLRHGALVAGLLQASGARGGFSSRAV